MRMDLKTPEATEPQNRISSWNRETMVRMTRLVEQMWELINGTKNTEQCLDVRTTLVKKKKQSDVNQEFGRNAILHGVDRTLMVDSNLV